MISEEDLNKCIDKLATINAYSSNLNIKQLTIEIGYILKEELDNVKTWNSQFDGKRPIQLDVQKLIQDNTQLAQENAKLHALNVKLTETIDHKIPALQNSIFAINQEVTKINKFILNSI